jgi:hypothetical protein
MIDEVRANRLRCFTGLNLYPVPVANSGEATRLEDRLSRGDGKDRRKEGRPFPPPLSPHPPKPANANAVFVTSLGILTGGDHVDTRRWRTVS